MRNIVALAVLLVTTLCTHHVHTQDYVEDASPESRESDVENIWALSRRSLKIDAAELAGGGSASLENPDYESIYSKVSSRPAIQRFARYRFSGQGGSSHPNYDTEARRYINIEDETNNQDELADYDFDADADDDDFDVQADDKYRHGKKDKKKKKKKKKKGDDDDSEEIKKLKTVKKYVPPFWYGKPKPGAGGNQPHVEQVGWILNNQASLGGWSIWPSNWNTPTGVAHNPLKWVDGKGWVGDVGAPWKNQIAPDWGPGYERKEDDEGGKKGKKGKKKKKKNKGKKKKNKKKKKKKKKKKGGGGHECEEDDMGRSGKKGRSLREGRGDKKDKGKKKKKKGASGGGGGWGKDPCDKGPKPWFGWPQKIKFIPPPPRGSQVWLNRGWPKPPKTGWSNYHGWNWKNKIKSGWGVSDLIGVVHL